MDFDTLPMDELTQLLKTEQDNRAAFDKILSFAKKHMPSTIWAEFDNMNPKKDIEQTAKWLQAQINKFPNTTGIYLGLDTLNMDDGKGTNVEVGFSNTCNPQEFSDDWTFECENYGDSYLIAGLSEVANPFNDDKKWSYDERNNAEYIIFLAYSGIVLKEALLKLSVQQDFLSIWGFHDGDMFFLVQKIGENKLIVTDIPL